MQDRSKTFLGDTARRGRWAALLALALAMGFAVDAHGRDQADAPKQSSADLLVSGDQTVRMWRFDPPQPGQHPAVILVHGLDGPEKRLEVFSGVARRLAKHGYVVILVYYFDRTPNVEPKRLETLFDAYLSGSATAEQLAEIRGYFENWSAALRDTVGHARRLPNVDPKRIGLIGFSLGGYLSVAVAADRELGIAALVECFGGVPRELWADLKHLPPTCIVHGLDDRIVPVREAYALSGWLHDQRIAADLRLYPTGHAFLKGAKVDWFSTLKAEGAAVEFLEKHLKVAKESR